MESKHWMIFYREADGNHFLFNGEWPISITPGGNAYGGTDTGFKKRVEKDVPILNEIMSSKKRLFKINQQRYIIIARGNFVEI